MAGKYTKEQVDYSKGTPEKHCGICEHYRHGKCVLVAGSIEPEMWCEKFEKGLRATIIHAAEDLRPHNVRDDDGDHEYR